MGVLVTAIAGFLLALMIYINGTLAVHTDAVWASFVTHFSGAVVALILLFALGPSTKKASLQAKAPLWTYIGGVLGALIVVLANITFNSKLGISGSIVLMLLGQTIFSIVIDQWGLLGMVKRKIKPVEYMQVVFICLGSLLLVFYAK